MPNPSGDFDWQCLAFLDCGGFGCLQKIRRVKDGQILACKEVQLTADDVENGQRLIEEAKLLKDLSHPCVVKFVDAKQREHRTYIVTELIEGCTLARLAKDKPLQVSRIRRFCRQICDALQYLHGLKPPVLHRDIKGDNIMICHGDSVKLIDFGLSMLLILKSKLNTTGYYTSANPGTSRFMAPEICVDKEKFRYSTASDIWAFGCSIYEMVTGTMPSKGGAVDPFPETDADLADFFTRCTAVDPKQRSTVQDLMQHKFLSSEDTSPMTTVLQSIGLRNMYPERVTTYQLMKQIWQPTKNVHSLGVGARLLVGLATFDSHARDSIGPSADFDFDFDFDSDEHSGGDDELHPMDALLASFLCCDKEVQQTLSHRLFTCKLAFPFVLQPDGLCEFLRWSLNDIMLEYQNLRGDVIEVSLPSATSLPVVSFVRIGSCEMSKSHLLNLLLQADGHHTFFNRNCRGGRLKRKLANGFMEASVFLPTSTNRSPEKMNHLNSPFLAVNLRGDLLEYRNMIDVSMQLAHGFVVVANVEDFGDAAFEDSLKQMEQSEGKFLLVVGCKKAGVKMTPNQLKEKVTQFRVRHKNVTLISAVKNGQTAAETDVQEKVTKALKAALPSTKSYESLEVTQLNPGHADDSTYELSAADRKAAKIFQGTTNCPVTQFKNKFLPLQGDIWIQLSRLYRSEISEKMGEGALEYSKNQRIYLRAQQVELHNQSPVFISEFVSQLLNCLGNHKSQFHSKLLLQCMRLEFDKKSRESLPELYTNYFRCRDSLLKAKRDKGSDSVAKCQRECQEAERTLLNASVGLENVFREIGQLYEAAKKRPKLITSPIKDKIDLLPDVFARMLLSGIPLEILDGDASSIPIRWVTEVIRSCKSLWGNKKLFVLSVLGIQSSGKSTLLNTMFGLRFPVSAGRCTRGAFLQLLEVDKDAQLPFDFLMVIDTEGLRAPELSSSDPHHDNELATLVIGLGDVTIINIKGENPSDIADILQIAVQAFIRMKVVDQKLQLQRSCIFIHQNVPAVSAKEKLRATASAMQDRLDEIAREAAESENIGNVRGFNDIISFDKENDIFYVPDLWHGSPPMAPVSKDYSVSVQQIKNHLLDSLARRKETFISLGDFVLRVKDIWKAILSEDFIFSFRNSLEMKAYNLMEQKFVELKTDLEKKAREWLYETAHLTLQNATSSGDLSARAQELQPQLVVTIDHLYNEADQNLERFFQEGNQRQYTSQWQRSKTMALQSAADEIKEELKLDFKSLKDNEMMEMGQKENKKHWERIVVKKARSLAMQLRGKAISEEEKKKEFRLMWQTVVQDLPTDSRQANAGKMEALVRQVLEESFKSDRQLLSMYLEQYFVNLFSTKESDFSVTETFLEGLTLTQSSTSSSPREKLIDSINLALANLRSHLDKVGKKYCFFQKSDARDVIEIVLQNFNQIPENPTAVKYTNALRVKLSVYACRLSLPTFRTFDQKFREKHSVKVKLEKLRTEIWNMFNSIINAKSNEVTAAIHLKVCLGSLIKKAIKDRLVPKLVPVVVKRIGRSKYHLIVRMLREFAEYEDPYLPIMEYVENSKAAAIKWMGEYIEKFMFTAVCNHSGERVTVCSEYAEKHLMLPMLKAVDKAVEAKESEKSANDPRNSLKKWLLEFRDQIKHHLALPLHDVEAVVDQWDVKDGKEFVRIFKEELKNLREEMHAFCRSLTITDLDSLGESHLQHRVFQSLWGCEDQCPFCNEPCSRATKSHDGLPHTCIQHRPQGASGWRKLENSEMLFHSCNFAITPAANVSFDFENCKIRTKNGADIEEAKNVYHRYSRYKAHFPDWHIEPDRENSSSKYWKWFMATHIDRLAKDYEVKVSNLPLSWKEVTREDAVQSIGELIEL